MKEGALAEAEEAFKQAILLESNQPQYHFEIANLYALQRDESERMGDKTSAVEKLHAAVAALQQAVMAKPDFLEAHFNLGVAYKRLERYEEAREAFREVLRLDPGQPQARLQIGTAYEEQGFYDEAEMVYHELLERYPGHPELRHRLDHIAQQRKRARQIEFMERNAKSSVFQNTLAGFTRGGRRQEGAS